MIESSICQIQSLLSLTAFADDVDSDQTAQNAQPDL